MIKFLFTRIALIFLGLILALLVGELLVRYLQYQRKPPSKVRQADALLHHSFIPNSFDVARDLEWEAHYKINSFGARDKEYSLKKPEKTYRILVLGDSFTEGQGVEMEATFTKLLENSLNEKITKEKNSIVSFEKIEVINSGILSYSPLLEYLYLKNKGLALAPDLVILNFDMSDPIDDMKYEAEALKNEKGIPVGFPKKETGENFVEANPLLPRVPKEIKAFFHRNSRIYRVIADSIRRKHLKIYPEFDEPEIKVGDLVVDKLIITRDEVPNYDAIWALTKRNLKLIKDVLKEKNIGLLLVATPYAHQVNGTEWSIGRKYWKFEDRVYSDRPFKTLETFSRDEGISFLNLLENFKSAKEKPLFFKKDGHFTKNGHKIVAAALAEYLIEKDKFKLK